MARTALRWCLSVVALTAVAVVGAACTTSGSTSAPHASPSPAAQPASPSVAPPSHTPPAPALEEGSAAWVAVSVATVWRSPTSPRPVDAPALAAPARIREWLAGLTTEERRGLSGRADTQALLGDRVVVLALGDGWAQVRVPDQPAPDRAGGYRGWVPRRQLTARQPVSSDRVVTVTAPTTWLRAADSTEVVEVSFGTRLPYVATDGDQRRVALPSGREVWVRSDRSSLHDAGVPALPATGRSVVRSARKFLGLEYLWAGRSGFGLDCSGLTSLDYRVHGLVIPRDAGPQSQAGQAVTGDLAPGDLLFYAADGTVHHVTMYVGRGRMIHAPATGQRVEISPVTASAGARRFLD